MRRVTIPLIILATLITLIAALTWYFTTSSTGGTDRRVTITGTYMPHHEILIDAPDNTQYVVTGFHTTNGTNILANRGQTRDQHYAPPPTEPVTITGHLRPTQPGMGPVREKHPPETDKLDTQGISTALNETFQEEYLELISGEAGGIGGGE